MIKITTLIENTTHSRALSSEHGLSLIISVDGLSILFDSGQSGAFAENARILGVDLSNVDFAILSHGHYDHSGGFSRFIDINKKAKVYLTNEAYGDYYNASGKFIGIDKERLCGERFVKIDGSVAVAPGITLISLDNSTLKYPIEPFGLTLLRNGEKAYDDFLHEHYLLIENEGKRVLFSGCSHKGVLNIMNALKPDIFVGGFHFSKLDITEPIGQNALGRACFELLEYDCTYYTAHCTGLEQYEYMKKIMGDKLNYLSTGDVVLI